MKAEKSHNLLYVSWGARKACDVIPVQLWRTENQESQWCKSSNEAKIHQCLRVGDGCSRSRNRTKSPFLCFLFLSCPLWIGCRLPAWWGWFLLNIPIQVLISSKNTLADTPWKYYFTSYLGIPYPSQANTKMNNYTQNKDYIWKVNFVVKVKWDTTCQHICRAFDKMFNMLAANYISIYLSFKYNVGRGDSWGQMYKTSMMVMSLCNVPTYLSQDLIRIDPQTI